MGGRRRWEAGEDGRGEEVGKWEGRGGVCMNNQ